MKKKPFTILHQDEDIIAVHKSAGLLVAADRWDPEAARLDTLVSAELSEKAGSTVRVYAVHRIDKDTSGVLLYALNADAHRSLNTAFQKRKVEKKYHAVVHGRITEKEFTVDLPLRADGDALHRTVIDRRRGKDAVTVFTVLETFKQFTLVEAQPITGRTHQIRVHLAEAGYPIVCDPLYGNSKPIFLSSLKSKWRGDPYEEKPLISRLALHSKQIGFTHPRTQEKQICTAEYPKDFKSLVHQLRKI